MQTLVDTLRLFWPYLLATATALSIVAAVVASSHVVLYKRDVRAAIGWVGLIWLTPLLGSILYWIFGINRIRRRAERLVRPAVEPAQAARVYEEGTDIDERNLTPLAELVSRATNTSLESGNRVTPLVNGDEAYPAMLAAIGEARRSVILCTYIFDADKAGELFLQALGEAAERGVEVRILIDGVGARYSRPRMTGLLRKRGLRAAEFLRPRSPIPGPYFNLRNHRKILVVDGRTGFTGGLNIREACCLDLAPRHPVRDIHFRFDGPVVHQLFAAAALDWSFTTGEELSGPAWALGAEKVAEVEARVVSDGPDEDFEAFSTTLLGALAVARKRARIVTPYFLPDQVLITALRVAGLRGVEIDIVVPEKGNLRFVQWASTTQLWQVLAGGCRVWLSPPPFDHSKLMIVDSEWSFVGSANWDPRSLRLNFELNVECYDRDLAESLDRHVDREIAASRRLSTDELAGRPLAFRLRDGVARLFSPYL